MNATPDTRKTPSDFDNLATEFNEFVSQAREALSKAQAQCDALGERRIKLVASATEYGYTSSFARTILDKP